MGSIGSRGKEQSRLCHMELHSAHHRLPCEPSCRQQCGYGQVTPPGAFRAPPSLLQLLTWPRQWHGSFYQLESNQGRRHKEGSSKETLAAVSGVHLQPGQEWSFTFY